MIEIKNGYKTYDGLHKVINNVSLTINSGELIAITGKSGSGKSTLLNIIGQLDNLSSGTLSIKGINVCSLTDQSRSKLRNQLFGFIFQSYYLIPNTTVIENIILPLYYSPNKMPNNIIVEKTNEILQSVGIENLKDRKIDNLSGGEMQRVAIARALINNPDIILADEPTGNLDKINSQNIFNTLKSLNDQGKTVIIVTHDESIAAKCSKIYDLNNGNLEVENV
ncbi:MAG: transporter ATP-binding protein [Haloplasmataceae bacterium]|jgi:putative ABC transport system ATP-binding protein|nr:transporter ATP-binding protein [Haloplasmataceae bacterium]